MNAMNPQIGIAAIATYEPPRKLGNEWFGTNLSRKFVHHTGTQSRPISSVDEVTMGFLAVKNLREETGCELRDCAAIVFVSPSFVPMNMARKFLAPQLRENEKLRRAARELAKRMGIVNRPFLGINWFCSGYAKALSLVRHSIAPAVNLQKSQFILVVTAGRISRITNYACAQSGPLFGDMATATMLSRNDSHKYPVYFNLKAAFAEKLPATGVFFNFEMSSNIVFPRDEAVAQEEPVENGNEAPQKLVFSLDGLGIAEVAPKAMANAVSKTLAAKQINPAALRFVVPHQAGTGIVRLAAMKLEQIGIGAEVVNGITGQVGNVSSSSIPFALKQSWQRLEGLIACPTAAVGDPGKPEVSQGCILLESLRKCA